MLDGIAQRQRELVTLSRHRLDELEKELGVRPPDTRRWITRVIGKVGEWRELNDAIAQWLAETYQTLDDLGCPQPDVEDWRQFLAAIDGLRDFFAAGSMIAETLEALTGVLRFLDRDQIGELDELLADFPDILDTYRRMLDGLEKVPLSEALEASRQYSEAVFAHVAEDPQVLADIEAGLADLREGRTMTLEEFAKRHGLGET